MTILPETSTDHPDGSSPDAPSLKWWGQSVTVWGTLVTLVTTVLPTLAPLLGLTITPATAHALGDQALQVIQAVGGLVGTIMALWGRSRASAPLARRTITLNL